MRLLSRIKAGERGVTAPIVGIVLVALFGAAMLSIDAGNLWQSRRAMITGTDSGALREAKVLAENPTSVTPGSPCPNNEWLAVLAANVPDHQDASCTLLSLGTDGKTGSILVEARKPVDYRFGGLFGQGSGSAFSLSAAMWGYVNEALGLRPIALCWNNDHVRDYLYPLNSPPPPGLLPPSSTHVNGDGDDYTAPDGTGIVHHITWVKQNTDGPCGDTPGNLGWMDYNGRSNPSGDTATWLRNGYYENTVSVDPVDHIGDCNADNGIDNERCDGDPGLNGNNAIRNAMAYLTDPDGDGVLNPLKVPIVIYDVAADGGNNAQFNVRAIVFVKIWKYNVQGADANKYMDIQFVEGILDGRCCSEQTDVDTGALGVALCGVDHDPQDPNSVGARCVPTTS